MLTQKPLEVCESLLGVFLYLEIMQTKIVYEFNYLRIFFQIKIAINNEKISSGATYLDGYDYCGFPAENNNFHSSEFEAVLYQCDFFINMFNKIIHKNEVISRTKAVKTLLDKLIIFKNQQIK